MEITVLIETVAGNGVRAKTGDPFGITAEGRTRDEAIQKVQAMIEAKLHAAGTELLQLTVPASANPWLRLAGSLDPNDPEVQEWQRIIEENRRKADEDPNYP